METEKPATEPAGQQSAGDKPSQTSQSRHARCAERGEGGHGYRRHRGGRLMFALVIGLAAGVAGGFIGKSFARNADYRAVAFNTADPAKMNERIDRMVSGIVRRLESLGESDIKSETVGKLIMEALKVLDDVAYVRFASVYKNFREAKDFEELLGELTGEEGEASPKRD